MCVCRGGQNVKLVIIGDLTVCAYWWWAILNLGLMFDVCVLVLHNEHGFDLLHGVWCKLDDHYWCVWVNLWEGW